MKVRHIYIRNFRGIKSLSWTVSGDFNCIVGSGDTCKTTILNALDYALTPRTAVTFDDTDFFNQDVDQDIQIQVTLSDWDENRPEIKEFFKESKFAQFKCGLTDTGPIPEPEDGGQIAISVSLRVDKSLEPKWTIVKGLDDGTREQAPLYASDRAFLGVSRLDVFADSQFTWGRNTILTRLSANQPKNLGSVLSDLTRALKQKDVSSYQGIVECQSVAEEIRTEAQKTGVKLSGLAPRIDLQRQSVTTGALSLHESNVPVRSKGLGSKRLIAAAMQMMLHAGKNIALIDELEIGLEPHRIRGMIRRLKNTNQQIFTTTHSPVVIRELDVSKNELYVCRRDVDGNVVVESLASVPDIQAAVRANAEAFLGSKIVACEGKTEIGCIRAYDVFQFDSNAEEPPVWSLATSYFDCSGGSKIRTACEKLMKLGYRAAVLCDNDAKDQISDEDVQALRDGGAYVCQWEKGNSTERQLFSDLPWEYVPAAIALIARNHDSLEHATIIDCIRRDPRAAGLKLSDEPTKWKESILLREVIGDVVRKNDWIKRIDYSQKLFEFALPRLREASSLRRELAELWRWVQADV